MDKQEAWLADENLKRPKTVDNLDNSQVWNIVSFFCGALAVILLEYLKLTNNLEEITSYRSDNKVLQPWKYSKKVHSFDNIHVAVGFALANVIFVETLEGIVVIDSTENGDNFLEAYRMVQWNYGQPKKIAALIYTHHHADHTFGGRGIEAGASI